MTRLGFIHKDEHRPAKYVLKESTTWLFISSIQEFVPLRILEAIVLIRH